MSGQPIRIGYCLSLTGALASNGKTARLAHQIWEKDVNQKGGLLGRNVEMVCIDDQTNPKLVLDIYKRLLDEEKVDLVVGGYGDNSVAPAMPLIMEAPAISDSADGARRECFPELRQLFRDDPDWAATDRSVDRRLLQFGRRPSAKAAIDGHPCRGRSVF